MIFNKLPSLSFTEVWLNALHDVIRSGAIVSPRGKMTLEMPQRTTISDMTRPVLTAPERQLSYRFMAAEAYWILSGSDRVEDIAKYNPNIAQFSDDGERFYGAYGPKIVGQLDYVVAKLQQDPSSRQAGLTIWRENPPETKDVPCTVAIFCNIRQDENKRDHLNVHVFMRSSDLWLGLPYDTFNFSMFGHLVCSKLNSLRRRDEAVKPGYLFLTAASSHIYQPNWDDAKRCIDAGLPKIMQPTTPEMLWRDERALMMWLKDLRDTQKGSQERFEDTGMRLRWWE
jgi:thymidylate synthase